MHSWSILALASAALALPSPQTSSNTTSPVVGVCNTGQVYCLSQITHDLGTFFPPFHLSISSKYSHIPRPGVPTQSILHQYCDQKATDDWITCNRCKRFPVPLPDCWERGPAAWRSLFECNKNGTYTWTGRCREGDVCAAGQCYRDGVVVGVEVEED
jgi:hypothetical protein